MRVSCFNSDLHHFQLIIVLIVTISSTVTSQIISDRVFKDVAQRVKKLLDGNLDEKGVLNVNKWFHDNLEDPFYISTINISESGTFTSYKGTFRKMELTGLKSFYIDTIELNVGSLDFNATARIPNLLLTGQYKLKGKISVLPVSGNGSFYMNFTDVQVNCVTSFTVEGGTTIKVVSVTLDTIPGEIDLQFEGLYGGGAASAFSNTILNVISHGLFEGIKANTLPAIETRMRDKINSRLKVINVSRLSPTSNSLVDGWIGRVQTMIRDKGYDPYPLVNETKDISLNLFGSKVNCQLVNGTVHGLSTLTRTGPIKVIYVNNSLLLEITMGFERLTSTFDWSLKIGSLVNRFGSITFNTTNLSTFTQLDQPLIKGSSMRLNNFSIIDFGHIWMDVNGLGTSDYIFEIFSNLVLNSFKRSLGDILTLPIQTTMKSTLNQQAITFL